MLGWKDVRNYDFYIVTQFEAIQLEWLLEWQNHDTLSVLLNEYPTVYSHIIQKVPHLENEYQKIRNKETNLVYSKEFEKTFIQGLEDWIIYATDPECYDKQPHNTWETSELLSITDFNNKTVIDIGSGTGSQTFRVAPYAQTVYAVEPVGNLRRYIKDKAKQLNYKNVYVVDGIMTSLPYPNNFVDIVIAGHVFGDYIEDEYKEMERVTKQGGVIILIPGNNDEDNDIHYFLTNKGFKYGSFLEPGDGMKRKYWKVV